MHLPGFGRWKDTAAIVLRGLGHRARLAAVEVEEAKEESARAVVLFAGAMTAFLLAGFALNLMVAAVFWDTSYRVVAIAVLCALQVAIGVAVVLRMRHQWRSWRPFSATTDQLELDHECLDRLFNPKDR